MGANRIAGCGYPTVLSGSPSGQGSSSGPLHEGSSGELPWEGFLALISYMHVLLKGASSNLVLFICADPSWITNVGQEMHTAMFVDLMLTVDT